MMAEKKIVINIQEDGQIHAETLGMVGTECVTELDKLMKDLARVVTRTKKDQYFKEGTTTDTTIKVVNNGKL